MSSKSVTTRLHVMMIGLLISRENCDRQNCFIYVEILINAIITLLWWHIYAITCRIIMSTSQPFMLACQIIMSTCQKKIITTSSSIFCFYFVFMLLTATYLLILYLARRHNFVTSQPDFLRSRNNFLTSRHIITYSRFFEQFSRLVRCYVNLSDNDVDSSDLYVDLSDNFVVIYLASIGQERVFKIYSLKN